MNVTTMNACLLRYKKPHLFKITRLLRSLILLLWPLFLVTSVYAETSLMQTQEKSDKILIVYYSRTGNTQLVAQHIQALVGGDIVQLETLIPYPDDYRATTIQAKQELTDDYRPALKRHIPNIEHYDIIFIGSPNWWGTMAMPVRTFLYDYPLSGKTLVPFITHEGSGLGRSVADLRKLVPNATILPGLAIRGGSAKDSTREIKQWLQNIGLLTH